MTHKPHYPQSKAMFRLIKKSKRVLVNCHRDPDLDSVGCALALRNVLRQMGKRVTVVCPSEIPERYGSLQGARNIQTQSLDDIDFACFDLFVMTDTSNIVQLTGGIDGAQPPVPTIVIDHHNKNTLRGEVKLVDRTCYSCAEILYRVFEDWGVEVNRLTATFLFAGIAGDTVLFSAPQYPISSMEIATELMRLGADKSGVIQRIFRNYHKDTLRTLGFLLQSLRFDPKNKIAYVIISQSVERRMRGFSDAKEAFADLFFSSIQGVEVGVFFLEADGFVKVGLRSRGVFDCGEFVRQLSGGGHPAAAGAFVKGDLKTVVRRVLTEARRMMRAKEV